MQVVLVTGFEPFNGDKVNPALEAVNRLQELDWEDVRVVTQPLPVVFHQSIEVLAETLERVRPDVVISVGQANGRSQFNVERVAVNMDDAPFPDNAGNQPVDATIVDGGPAAYFSTLPVKEIVENVRAAGIPATVSQSAGTYVCNHIFYGLSHLLATRYPDVRGGFIHIPYLPEQAAHMQNQPSMSVETVVKALEITICTVVEERMMA
jgi:pyroglutamyl-peptidase